MNNFLVKNTEREQTGCELSHPVFLLSYLFSEKANQSYFMKFPV